VPVVVRPGSQRGAIGTTVASQLLMSVTNFSATVWAGVALTSRDFGVFAAVGSVYFVWVQLTRTLIVDRTLVRVTRSLDLGSTSQVSAATVAGLGVGAAAMGGLVLIGLTVGGMYGPTLQVLGLLVPGLGLFETHRLILTAQGKHARAAALSAAWPLAVLTIAATLQLTTVTLTASVALFVWLMPASTLGIAVAVRHLQVTNWRNAKLTGILSGGLAAEQALVLGAGQLVIWAIAIFLSPADLGYIRGAQLLLGPMTVLFLAADVGLLRPAQIRKQRGPGSLRRYSVGASISLSVLTASLGACAYLALSIEAVQHLVGPTWLRAGSLLPYAVLSVVGNAAILGARLEARVNDQVGVLVRARAIAAPITLMAIPVAWLTGSADWTAAMLGLAGLAATVPYWSVVRKAPNV
jgi:hypothetical protein